MKKSWDKFRKSSLNKRAKRLRKEARQKDKMLRSKKQQGENVMEKKINKEDVPVPLSSKKSGSNPRKSKSEDSLRGGKGGSSEKLAGLQHVCYCNPQMAPVKALAKASKRNAFPLVEKPGRLVFFGIILLQN